MNAPRPRQGGVAARRADGVGCYSERSEESLRKQGIGNTNYKTQLN